MKSVNACKKNHSRCEIQVNMIAEICHVPSSSFEKSKLANHGIYQ